MRRESVVGVLVNGCCGGWGKECRKTNDALRICVFSHDIMAIPTTLRESYDIRDNKKIISDN